MIKKIEVPAIIIIKSKVNEAKILILVRTKHQMYFLELLNLIKLCTGFFG